MRGLHEGEGRRQRRLTVIDVADRSDVHMNLVGHWFLQFA